MEKLPKPGIDLVDQKGVISGKIFNYPEEKLVLINMDKHTQIDEIDGIIAVYKSMSNSFDMQYLRLQCQFGKEKEVVSITHDWVAAFIKEFTRQCKADYIAIVVTKNNFPLNYFDYASPTVIEVFESITRADVKLSRLALVNDRANY